MNTATETYRIHPQPKELWNSSDSILKKLAKDVKKGKEEDMLGLIMEDLTDGTKDKEAYVHGRKLESYGTLVKV